MTARRLVGALDEALRGNEIDPASDFALSMVRAFGSREWASVALAAGVGLPSDATRAVVLSIYAGRIAALAQTSAQCGREIEQAARVLP